MHRAEETAGEKEVLRLIIEMFVSATLRGSAKGTGKVMYTMRTKQENGQNYEKPPEIGKAESTANRLVLWSICRALFFFNFYG